MRIYITGVSGFLGSRLARYFLARGYQVGGSGSSPASRSGAPAELARFDVLPLGEEPAAEVFAGFDALVHAAYTSAPDTESLNVSGTVLVAEAFARCSRGGVATGRRGGAQVFVSSHSADPEALSEYGRLKHRLETFFLERGHWAIRPGLIVGYGGLFRNMMDLVWKLPLVPLLDGGKSWTPVSAAEDLGRSIEGLLLGALGDSMKPRAVHLFNQHAPRLMDLLVALRQALGRRLLGVRLPLFVPVPSALLVPPLVLARWLKISLPIDIENVRGYRAVQEHHRASDYPTVLGGQMPCETPLEDMLEHAAAELRAQSRQ